MAKGPGNPPVATDLQHHQATGVRRLQMPGEILFKMPAIGQARQIVKIGLAVERILILEAGMERHQYESCHQQDGHAESDLQPTKLRNLNLRHLAAEIGRLTHQGTPVGQFVMHFLKHHLSRPQVFTQRIPVARRSLHHLVKRMAMTVELKDQGNEIAPRLVGQAQAVECRQVGVCLFGQDRIDCLPRRTFRRRVVQIKLIRPLRHGLLKRAHVLQFRDAQTGQFVGVFRHHAAGRHGHGNHRQHAQQDGGKNQHQALCAAPRQGAPGCCAHDPSQRRRNR